MPTPDKTYPTQHIGGTILVVMMEVDPEHEDDFNRWYNDEHLPERLEIPGYVSARRFKLEEGDGVLKYLCIWELEDGSPLHSEAYKAQQRRPSEQCDRERYLRADENLAQALLADTAARSAAALFQSVNQIRARGLHRRINAHEQPG